MSTPYSASDRHKIRPRWVWIGLLAGLAGLVVVSLGLMATSWTVAVPGIVLAAAGAVAAIYGGLYYDVAGRATTTNPAKDVRENPVTERPGPEAHIEDDKAEAKSRVVDERRREFLDAAMHHPFPSTVPLGAGLVLLVCVWVLLAQGALYPHTSLGQGHALLDMGVAIVLALAAMRLLLAAPRVWLSVLVAIGGVTYLLVGLLIGHDSRSVEIAELAYGVLVLLGAALTLDRRKLARGRP